MKDKRKCIRIPTCEELTLVTPEKKVVARIVDISQEGIKMRVDSLQDIESMKIESIWIGNMELRTDSPGAMRVVWTKKNDQHMLCGIWVSADCSDGKVCFSDMVEKITDRRNKIPQNRLRDYDEDFIVERRKWVEAYTNTKLDCVGGYAISSHDMRGNVENPIGTCQIPLGIAGPVRVNGEYAKGDFLVPMATTEGALVMTYHRGMRVLSKAGGVNVRVLKDEVHISPAFFVKNIIEAEKFIAWVKDHLKEITQEAEKTTRHGRLLHIEPIITGRRVILKFSYFTHDAQGLNMINKATDAACKFITKKTTHPHIIRSDFSAIKKVAAANIYQGQGKSVFADITIPKKVLRLLQTTPERVCAYQDTWKHAVAFSGQVGRNIHVANLLAAVFIACGQDAADVAMSHVGILVSEVTKDEDLYLGLYISNLMVGTVGGGTGLGTQQECLNIMGCYGKEKAKKFAEIIAAAALAGEVACNAALENGTYVEAHELYGRNRPQEEK